jgi:hypothetical protein
MSNATIRLALILPTIAIVYWFWIRPILKTTPTLKAFYDAEAGWWAAFNDKFAGIKQKIAGSLIGLACIVVELWDYVAPALGAVDTTPLTSQIPSWAWPLIAIAATALLNYLRSLADKRNNATITVLADTMVANDVAIPAAVQVPVAVEQAKAV